MRGCQIRWHAGAGTAAGGAVPEEPVCTASWSCQGGWPAVQSAPHPHHGSMPGPQLCCHISYWIWSWCVCCGWVYHRLHEPVPLLIWCTAEGPLICGMWPLDGCCYLLAGRPAMWSAQHLHCGSPASPAMRVHSCVSPCSPGAEHHDLVASAQWHVAICCRLSLPWASLACSAVRPTSATCQPCHACHQLESPGPW